MDLTAEAIYEIAKSRHTPVVVKVHGIDYLITPDAEGQWDVDDSIEQPDAQPKPLVVRSLRALCEFARHHATGRSLEFDGALLLHVEGPTTVHVRDAAIDSLANRRCWATAALDSSFGKFEFGRYYDKESFGIALQTMFSPVAAAVDGQSAVKNDRDALHAFAASMKVGKAREYVDDGVTQTVTASNGVHLGAEVTVPNPVHLAPYRTFRDVDQPTSPFVFRVAGGDDTQPPSCALFEADAGTWQLDAMGRVGTFLREQLATQITAGTIVLLA